MDRIEQESPAELKQKLGKRLGLAAVLIVVLLGALAVFDHLSNLEREDTSSQPVAPVQPRIGPSISSGRPSEVPPVDVPITPSPGLAPKETVVLPEPPPKPEISAQPAVAPLPAPVIPPAPVAPAPMAKPAPVPASKLLAPVSPIASPSPPPQAKPAAALPAQPSAAVAPAVSVPEDTASAPVLGAPATRLPAPASTPPVATPRPALSRLAAGFILQAGVFTSTERAEELKAKLVMAGVPVTIESRVQVGPFASQKEADAARKKIRDLGIDSIVIPPRAGRR